MFDILAVGLLVLRRSLARNVVVVVVAHEREVLEEGTRAPPVDDNDDDDIGEPSDSREREERKDAKQHEHARK